MNILHKNVTKIELKLIFLRNMFSVFLRFSKALFSESTFLLAIVKVWLWRFNRVPNSNWGLTWMTLECSQVTYRSARLLLRCIMGSVVCVLSVLQVTGPLLTIIIDLYKMNSWAEYNCMPGRMWPTGLEFDSYALDLG